MPGMLPARVAMLVTSNLLHDNRVRRQAQTLASAGYQVTVFSHIDAASVAKLRWSPSQSSAEPRAVPVPRPAWEEAAGLSRARGHAADLFRWGGSRALWQAAKEERAGVYHAHDLDTLAAAAWLAQRDRARLVYDAHELFIDQMDLGPAAQPTTYPSRLKQALARGNYARLERRLIGQASAVITVSRSIAQELAARYGIPEPVVVLNTPVYRDLGAGSDWLRLQLGLGPDIRLLLLQGSVLPGRGLIELVQSLTLLPENHHLVFLGFNLGVYQEPIRQEIARLKLGDRTHLLDALPPEELLTATASADVGILLLAGHNLNDRYAMPNKLFEYLMAGLPFVATGWPEIGRVARETGAGLTIAEPTPSAITPAAIAQAVQQILADPVAYQNRRLAALNAARVAYNWEKQADVLLSLYQALSPG